jgi:hypothetical protein
VAAAVVVSAAAISAGNGYKSVGEEAWVDHAFLLLSLERFPQRRIAGILALKSAQRDPER